MLMRVIKVHCDGMGCGEILEVNTYLAKQAQNNIKQRGWTVSTTRGIRYHYCPKCTILNSLNGILEG